MTHVFKVATANGVMIVELAGVVSSLADDSITRELDAVRAQLRSGKQKSVVIDLGQVAYFGSSMLEAIRTIWNEVSPHGGKLALCNASEVGREILQVAKFDHLWPLVESRAEALKLV
jgi:anti-anti-sigma factor